MSKKHKFTLFVLAFLFFYLNASFAQGETAGIPLLERITKNDRILILAPHPDDEAIGCAGVIQRAVAVGADLHIVYLTNGDHNQVAFIVYEKRLTFRKGEFIHMGKVRMKEAINAMELLGVDRKNLVFLGYPDFGTFAIFNRNWGNARPYKSLLTRISRVPYKEDFSYGFPYKGESILSDLKSLLLLYGPNKIFVSHPADVNVDHKALPLFLEVALADLRDYLPRPKIYPYLIHCVGWPLPRHYHPELALSPPEKFRDSSASWQQLPLAPEEVEKKHRSILSYKSQTESSAFYLLSFCRRNELFGVFPEVNLFKTGGVENNILSFLKAFSRDPRINKRKPVTESRKDKVSYSISDDNLIIGMGKPERLDRRFMSMLYIFGYSYSRPFPLMPKLRVVIKFNRYKVYKEGRLIKAAGIVIRLTPNQFEIKIPLELLKDPDFILIAFRAPKGVLPEDALAFRKINIRKERGHAIWQRLSRLK